MMANENDNVMQRAVNIILDMSKDPEIRESVRLREKALHDEASALGNARREGKAEGRAEERAAMIARMRALGVSEEVIESIVSD